MSMVTLTKFMVTKTFLMVMKTKYQETKILSMEM